MKHRIFLLTTCIMIVASMLSCKDNKKVKSKPEIPPVVEFDSIKSLVHHYITCINNGYIQTGVSSFMPKKAFINELYMHVDTAKDKNEYTADVFWRSFLGKRRDYALYKNIQKYKNKIVSIEHIGEPKIILNYPGFSYIRRLTVFLFVQKGDKTLSIADNNIFGIIVKKNKKYRLLHMYKD